MITRSVQRFAETSGCEVRDDDLTRQLYSTDASPYQIVPDAVAFPRSAEEAGRVIRAAAEAGIPVIPRGAGTGLAGGALGEGLVIEFSRYNRAISNLDIERRSVVVEPGVVLDQLNDYLRPHGLQFGPDVATSSRATLGGMIANNSSGARVAVYGMTAEHVLSLDVVLCDGVVERIGRAERDSTGAGGRLDALSARAGEIVRRHAQAIAERLPPGLSKRWPGYAFDRYLGRPSLVELVCGSEGTLASIVSAELDLVPLPKERGLGLVFFASVEDAMQATVELLDLQPAAIEHIDRTLFDQTRGQLVFRATRSLLRLDDQPCEAILLVEFIDNVAHKLAELERRHVGARKLICREPAQQVMVWAMRKAGLALVTGRKGPAKPVPGIEDAAIRPQHLPEYVRRLRSILSPLGIEASFYGHASAGLLHVRPILDLHTAEGVARYRQVVESVSALVREFKGSFCGEHGVGIARTEFLPDHLGPELMEATRELKRLFDPKNVMNPGKIVPFAPADGIRAAREPYRIDRDLRQGAGHAITTPFVPVLGFVEKDGSFVANLEQCNGNGVCLKNAATMCPTYIVTHEELMSTRGRANTIRAAMEGRLGGREPLLSDELEQALAPCLACKACKSECPSNVDMALLKAELLHARHKARGIPLVDRVIAAADLLGRLGCAVPSLANTVLRMRVVRWLMQKTLGIDARRALPEYARERFDRWLVRRARAKKATPVGDRCPKKVVLWDDTWVRYHEPDVGMAAVRVLEAAGFEVVPAEGRKCCGRPAFSRGLLDEAAGLGAHNVTLLETRYAGLPVVFLEPSCHAMFIDEYRQLGITGADRLAARCLSFEQFMSSLLEREPGSLPFVSVVRDGSPAAEGCEQFLHVAIHGHCHAKALTEVSILKRLAERVPGVSATLLDTACCGMAGAYGMMHDKYDLSLQVAAPMLEKLQALPPGTRIVASGTSCRQQIRHLTGREPLHMAELLAEALSGA